MKKRVSVGIIGPQNVDRAATFLGLTSDKYRQTLETIGKILAKFDIDLVFLPDNGASTVCATSYKQHQGKTTFGVIPNDVFLSRDSSFNWNVCDDYILVPNWSSQPPELVKQITILLVLGLGAGTMIELGYAAIYPPSTVIIMKNLVSQELPKEVVIPGLHYLHSTNDLQEYLLSTAWVAKR